MPRKATIYAYSVIVVGMAVLLGALWRWQSPDMPRFLAYLGLACLGGMLKVRIPGMEGTYSLSFLFALLSVLDLMFPEAIVIGAVGAFVQSVWRTAKRPKFVQVLFNGANFSISIGLCCLVGRASAGTALHHNLAAELSIMAGLFYAVNTVLVSVVISMLEGTRVAVVWRRWLTWSFPLYLIGAFVAGVVVASGRSGGWQTSLLVLPIMGFIFVCYRLYVNRHKSDTSLLNKP